MVDLEAWERAKPHIQAALDAGGNTHSLEDVFTGLESNEYQFWHTPVAYCVTEVLEFPQKKVFNFWLAGGDMRVLFNVVEPVAWAWAKSVGCKMAIGQFKHRKGWDRVIPASYQKGWIVFSKSE